MNRVFSCRNTPVGFLLRITEGILRLIGIALLSGAIWTIVRDQRFLEGIFVLLLGGLAFAGSLCTFEPDVAVDAKGIKVLLFWRWHHFLWKDVLLKKRYGLNLVLSDNLPLLYLLFGLRYYAGSRCFGLNMQTDVTVIIDFIRNNLPDS